MTTGDVGSVSVTGIGMQSGSSARIVLDVFIPENCHIQAHEPAEPFLVPTVVEVDDVDELEIDYPSPRRKDLGVPGSELLVYDNHVTIWLRGLVTGAPGRITGRMRYQACIGGACLPPRTETWNAAVLAVDADRGRVSDRSADAGADADIVTITCTDATSRFWNYLDGTLHIEERAVLDDHLARCRTCSDQLDFARAVDRFLGSRAASGLTADVRARLERYATCHARTRSES